MNKAKRVFWLGIALAAIGSIGAAQGRRLAAGDDDLLLKVLAPSAPGMDGVRASDFAEAGLDYEDFAAAANITAEAIQQVMKTVTPFLYKETDIDRMLGDYFVSKGVPRLPCWDTHHNVAVGENTVKIDHQATTKVVLPGDLVLVDTGARFNDACSDVARTFPVGLKFKTNVQRVYYYLALNALKLGENLAARNVGKLSLDKIDKQMRAYLVKNGVTNPYYCFYHYVGTGTDVHGLNTGWDPHSPIQPGQYFAFEVLFGFVEGGNKLGIHIEDTYAVLASKVVRLSAKCPRDIDPPPAAPPISVRR